MDKNPAHRGGRSETVGFDQELHGNSDFSSIWDQSVFSPRSIAGVTAKDGGTLPELGALALLNIRNALDDHVDRTSKIDARRYSPFGLSEQRKKVAGDSLKVLDTMLSYAPAAFRKRARARRADLEKAADQDDGLDPSARMILFAAVWPHLPKDPLTTRLVYHEMVERGDAISARAIESMPAVLPGALPQDEIAELRSMRLTAESPAAGAELGQLNQLEADIHRAELHVRSVISRSLTESAAHSDSPEPEPEPEPITTYPVRAVAECRAAIGHAAEVVDIETETRTA